MGLQTNIVLPEKQLKVLRYVANYDRPVANATYLRALNLREIPVRERSRLMVQLRSKGLIQLREGKKITDLDMYYSATDLGKAVLENNNAGVSVLESSGGSFSSVAHEAANLNDNYDKTATGRVK